VLAELARIGFSNVTEAIEVKRGRVKIRDTDELPADAKAAISEIRQGRDGVTVKFHDKARALEQLGRHLGLYKENIDLNVNISLADLVNGSYAIERGELAAPARPAIEHQGDTAQPLDIDPDPAELDAEWTKHDLAKQINEG
jgi:hypothetical protein